MVCNSCTSYLPFLEGIICDKTFLHQQADSLFVCILFLLLFFSQNVGKEVVQPAKAKAPPKKAPPKKEAPKQSESEDEDDDDDEEDEEEEEEEADDADDDDGKLTNEMVMTT